MYRMCVLVTQSCPALYDPMDCSPQGSSVHGILQARILETAALFFSRDLPNPGIKVGSPTLQVDALQSELLGKPTHKMDNSKVLLYSIGELHSISNIEKNMKKNIYA